MTLNITLLVKAPDGYIVGRCDLTADVADMNTTWSMGMPVCEWIMFLWSILHAPQRVMRVMLHNEALLWGAPQGESPVKTAQKALGQLWQA